MTNTSASGVSQLPVILSANFDPSTANIISALYSFGMMPGQCALQALGLSATPARLTRVHCAIALPCLGLDLGGIVCGFVSDLYGGRRACVCATMMIALVPLLLFLAFYMESIPTVTLLVLLCLMGCLVGGPNNIITSAVAADLAEDPSIKVSTLRTQ